MNYINILAYFGLDESSFEEKEVIPIQEGNSLVFYLTKSEKSCLYLNCKSNEIISDGHYERRPNVGFIGSKKFVLRINRKDISVLNAKRVLHLKYTD